MTAILVKPASGRRVVTPAGQRVPETFGVNPADPYWARALRDGDIVRADPESQTAKAVVPVVAAVQAPAEPSAEKK